MEKVIGLISGLVDKYAATAAQKYGIVAGVVVAIIIIVMDVILDVEKKLKDLQEAVALLR